MSLLTAAIPRKYSANGWDVQHFEMGTDIIYKGGGVNINTSGFAVAATDTASERFAGIAAETVDNSGGSSGVNVRVNVSNGAGKVKMPGSFAQTDVGEIAYVTNDNDIGTPGSDPGNTVVVGRFVEFDTSTLGWVQVQAFSVNA